MAGAIWDFTQYVGPLGYSLTVPSTVAGQTVTVTGYSTFSQQVQLYGNGSNGIGLVGGDNSHEIYPGGYIKIDLTAISSSTLSTRTLSFKGFCPANNAIWASVDEVSSIGGQKVSCHSQAASGTVSTLYTNALFSGGLVVLKNLYLGPTVTVSSATPQGCTIALLQSTGDY